MISSELNGVGVCVRSLIQMSEKTGLGAEALGPRRTFPLRKSLNVTDLVSEYGGIARNRESPSLVRIAPTVGWVA